MISDAHIVVPSLVPGDARVVHEASCDAQAPVSDEPVSDGSHVLSFGPLLCVADNQI